MGGPAKTGDSVRALTRGIAVLQAINRGGSVTMTEIARASGIPYPTVFRLVETLMVEGLVEREPMRRRYRPTALVQTLAHGFQGDGRLVNAARPHIVALTRRIGWPISVSTPVGHSMVLRDSTHALTTLTFSEYFPGYASPIIDSAAGLVYLASLDADTRAGLLASFRLMADRQQAAVIDRIEEDELFPAIATRGYATRAYNQFTRNPGKTSSIAAPVREPDGRVIGAVALAFFASALKMPAAEERFAGPLLECTAAIDAALAES